MPTGLSNSENTADWSGSAGGLRYAPPPGEYDEALNPHWHPLFESLDDLGPSEIAHRWWDAQHLIRENGVTYNVYGDPRGAGRPWQLDPIPLLISSAEAAQLETGLIQRARLLELILADLYGRQTLLGDGLLPAAIVYSNPGFLRPCHGIPLPGGRFLHLYAANLGRGRDGRFRVLGDRTQAPSGAGYALENRIVMTRTLPEAFRDCRVHRLALFFQTFRDSLRSIAPRNKDNPRVVLLTPGPYNETYFEHAYLARYLGFTLVEGGDIAVRDNRVFLKVLGGLQPIDVILRRLDDDFCDPLELRPDSFLGVPGLTHAVRSGNVAVANALGAGVLETPALLAYLPRLCRALLGEDLLLESVPTRWCGDPEGLSHLLDHFNDVVVKPAFPTARLEPVFPGELSVEQQAALIGNIRARPQEFVAQDRLELSTTPVLQGGKLVPRKMVVRTYLAADRDGFMAMPGGLTRVSGKAETLVVSMQRGGGSKDTWVLADSSVNEFSLLPAGGFQVPLTRGGGDLPSRAADNLFWLGRYAERADGIARLLRCVATRQVERSGFGEPPELGPLLGALNLRSQERLQSQLPRDPLLEVIPAVFDSNHPNSLGYNVLALRRIASVARDLISIDMWRVLNNLAGFPTEPHGTDGEEANTADVLDLLNRTIITLAAFGGLALESMTRAEGWRFLDMGRKLERSMHTAALLKATLIRTIPQEVPVLDALLEVADSGMTYRRRYLGSLRVEAVLDLLVFDETNPRSLASQLAALEDDVNHLPRPNQGAGRSNEQRQTLAVLSAVRLAEVENLAAVQDGERPALRQLLDDVWSMLPALSDSITLQFLSHLQTSRHLASEGLPPSLPRSSASL